MSERNDGGPAFPPHADEITNFAGDVVNHGMTLRDWFAGQALSGMFAAPQPPDFSSFETALNYYARVAYSYADAMLAERSKP